MLDKKEEVEIYITDKNNIGYDLNHNIYFTSNLGKMKLTPQDALEIAYALLDATGHLDKKTEEIMVEIEEELVS